VKESRSQSAQEGVDRLVAALRASAEQGRHHGRAGLNAAAKRQWSRRLAAEDPPGGWALWLPRLAHDPVPAIREVAALLVVRRQWTDDGALAVVDRLMRDDDWEVREWAVEPAALMVTGRPDGPTLFQAWLSEGGRVRRAMVVACRTWVREGQMTAQEALAVADRVVDDPDAYVQANVGSYFLGDGVLPRFPRETALWLTQRAARPELSPAFWRNVAALFRSAAARESCRWHLIEAAERLLAAGPPPSLIPKLRRAAGHADPS
jgi:hypothetical protein